MCDHSSWDARRSLELPQRLKTLTEAGFVFLLFVSVYKVPFTIGECVFLVSFRGYKKYIPYFT